jgi:uncharacterized protein Yka (UPF0111/DUF47 family)
MNKKISYFDKITQKTITNDYIDDYFKQCLDVALNMAKKYDKLINSLDKQLQRLKNHRAESLRRQNTTTANTLLYQIKPLEEMKGNLHE